MTTPTDCLVLKIEEYDISTGKLDMSMFVLFDQRERVYVLRGMRRYKSTPFSFTCKHRRDVAFFIQSIMCKNNQLSYILYNYDDLPMTSKDIDFQSLCDDEDYVNEISAYDNKLYNNKETLKYLGMLKTVFNYW
jgi:hypothetical protein